MINVRSYFRRSPFLSTAWLLWLLVVAGVTSWVAITKIFGYENKTPIQTVKLALADYPVSTNHVVINLKDSEQKKKLAAADPAQHSQPQMPAVQEHPEINSASWRHNAAGIKAGIESKPKIAIVLTGLGLNVAETTSAINDLPPEVTLAFLPYTQNIEFQLSSSKQRGHENLIVIPMEPMSFPDDDPGPGLLLTGMTGHEVSARFAKLLGESKTHVGIVNSQGSRFVASSSDMQVLFKDLKKRDLIFVEQPSSFRSCADKLAKDIAIPYVKQNCVVDLSDASAMETWMAVAETAKQSGFAAVSIKMQPGSVVQIRQIAEAMSKDGIELVPITYKLQSSESKVST